MLEAHESASQEKKLGPQVFSMDLELGLSEVLIVVISGLQNW